VKGPRRSILHLDLHPFFVNVERSLDPSLRGRPLIIGSGDEAGIVAAASAEARDAGVRAGQRVAAARRLCPAAAFRPGDLEAYARVSDDVTQVLLEHSRRVERPSADEAYVDLTREGEGGPHPVGAAEAIKDAVQRRLGLDASLGLASTRLTARVASGWARPRGLLVVLPGYESSFLGRQPVSSLPALPGHLLRALQEAGLTTIGAVAEAPEEALAPLVGPAAARLLREAARTENEPPIATATPPLRALEEAKVRDPHADRAALAQMLDTLAARALRQLRPFRLRAGRLRIEVRRGDGVAHHETSLGPALDEAGLCALARDVSGPMLDPASSVRGLSLRLDRLEPEEEPAAQGSLFAEQPRPNRRR
jgi:DNA polymerase-4